MAKIQTHQILDAKGYPKRYPNAVRWTSLAMLFKTFQWFARKRYTFTKPPYLLCRTHAGHLPEASISEVGYHKIDYNPPLHPKWVPRRPRHPPKIRKNKARLPKYTQNGHPGHHKINPESCLVATWVPRCTFGSQVGPPDVPSTPQGTEIRQKCSPK